MHKRLVRFPFPSCQDPPLFSSLFIAMGLGEGDGNERELESSRCEVQSPLKEKEAALVVGRLNTNHSCLKLTSEHWGVKQSTLPAFQLAKLRSN